MRRVREHVRTALRPIYQSGFPETLRPGHRLRPLHVHGPDSIGHFRPVDRRVDHHQSQLAPNGVGGGVSRSTTIVGAQRKDDFVSAVSIKDRHPTLENRSDVSL